MRIFLFLILVLFIFSCSEEKVKPAVDLTLTEERIPDYESWKTEIIFSSQGVLEAVLFADHLQKFEEDHTTFLDSVKVDFYDEDGNKTTVLTSNKARVDDITKNMFATENVVVKSDSGVVLKTEELTWQNKIQKITSDQFVTITSPAETIQGYGFESDQGLRNYKIFKITYSATVTDSIP